MTFLCYTQDLVGFRPSQYRTVYNGSNNMAVFLLEKHGRDNYGYVVQSIELKRPDGWVSDTNVLDLLGVGLLSDDPMVAPLNTNIIPVTVARPSEASTWRCRVALQQIPRLGPGWRATARHLLYRAGLLNPTNFTRFEIVSGEVPP